MSVFCLSHHNSLHVNPVIMNKIPLREGTSLVSPHSVVASTVLSFSHWFLFKVLSQSRIGTWKDIALCFRGLLLHFDKFWYCQGGWVSLSLIVGIWCLELFWLNFIKCKFYFVMLGCIVYKNWRRVKTKCKESNKKG